MPQLFIKEPFQPQWYKEDYIPCLKSTDIKRAQDSVAVQNAKNMNMQVLKIFILKLNTMFMLKKSPL